MSNSNWNEQLGLHRARLVRTAKRILRDDALAEDAVQDATFDAWKRMAPEAPFELKRVEQRVRWKALDLLDKRRRQEQVANLVVESEQADLRNGQIEARDAITLALSRFAPADHATIVRVLLEERSHDAVAREFARSRSSVARIAIRARSYIQDRLRQSFGEGTHRLRVIIAGIFPRTSRAHAFSLVAAVLTATLCCCAALVDLWTRARQRSSIPRFGEIAFCATSPGPAVHVASVNSVDRSARVAEPSPPVDSATVRPPPPEAAMINSIPAIRVVNEGDPSVPQDLGMRGGAFLEDGGFVVVDYNRRQILRYDANLQRVAASPLERHWVDVEVIGDSVFAVAPSGSLDRLDLETLQLRGSRAISDPNGRWRVGSSATDRFSRVHVISADAGVVEVFTPDLRRASLWTVSTDAVGLSATPDGDLCMLSRNADAARLEFFIAFDETLPPRRVDTTLSGSSDVIDVAFSPGRMYVATEVRGVFEYAFARARESGLVTMRLIRTLGHARGLTAAERVQLNSISVDARGKKMALSYASPACALVVLSIEREFRDVHASTAFPGPLEPIDRR